MNILKKIFLWTYERNTWQWDTLCALILVFIFLTPKGWFQGSERHPGLKHQSQSSSSVLIAAEVLEKEQDTTKLRDHVRALTGRDDVEIVATRKVVDKEGKTLGYQVDMR